MLLSFHQTDRSRYAEPAAALCCAVLAALALWLLVRLVWALVPSGDAAIAAAPMRVGGTAPGPVAAARSIASWHLFGAATTGPGAAGNAPATTLSLILRGTFASADPASGIAVIADAGGEERAWRVGEEVAAGTRLSAVYADHVVFDHEGVAEALRLPRDRNLVPGDIVRATPTTASSHAAANPLAAAPPARSFDPASNKPSTHAPANWQATVAQLRQHPDELARRMQVVPVLDGGKLTGVRLSAGSDVALMRQLGLAPGDIVTQVNGRPIDSLARGQEILSSLGNATSVRVTVLRNGHPTDLTVGLQ